MLTAALRDKANSSARFSALINNDGGDPPTLSLFWGDNDGGVNSQLNPNDDILWDYRIDLNGTHSEGMVSHLVSNLSLGSNYYYRWMASNSVKSKVWSLPPQEGIKAWWKFDESSGNLAFDSINDYSGTLVGIDDSSRVFGASQKAIIFATTATCPRMTLL